MRLFFLLLIMLVATQALPQDTQSNSSEDRLEELRKLQEVNYPDFIGEATAAPTPSASAPQPTPTPVYNFPDQLQVLAGDLSSTTTWFATRERIEPGFEDLRMLMLSSADVEEVTEEIDALNFDLDIIERMAPVQAPLQAGAIARSRSKIETQLGYIGGDYLSGSWRQLGNTDELLRREVDGLQRLLQESDLDRGGAEAEPLLPDDWNPRQFRHRSFSERIGAWQTDRLLQSYSERRAMLQQLAKEGFKPTDAEMAREMGELARELATRQSDVPLASRTAFRNAALRLDVMSENLLDYLVDGNELHARRQARAIEDAELEVQAFLDLQPRFSR